MLPQKTFAEAKSLEVGVGRGKSIYREGGKEVGRKLVCCVKCVNMTSSVSSTS